MSALVKLGNGRQLYVGKDKAAPGLPWFEHRQRGGAHLFWFGRLHLIFDRETKAA